MFTHVNLGRCLIINVHACLPWGMLVLHITHLFVPGKVILLLLGKGGALSQRGPFSSG